MVRKLKKAILLTIAALCILVVLSFLFIAFFTWYFDIPKASDYIGWKDVSIEGYGRFKVPEEWIVTQNDDVMFITDKPIEEENYNIYLIGTIKENVIDYISFNILLGEDVKRKELIRSQVFSNSTHYAHIEYVIGDKSEIKQLIDLGSSNNIDLIAWDDLVDEETMIKIARSFTRA